MLDEDNDDNDDNRPTSREYHFSMSVDELSDMEKEVNDFCNDEDDDDDDSNDLPSRANKQQRQPNASFAPITTTDDNNPNAPNEDDEHYNSDSSSSQKLRDLILGKRGETDSDEESLGDGDAPRGWTKNSKDKTND